ncbi:hypothetical protein [Intestinibacter bartlettii]|uniref:hypothetical protein n=1 Tax=Intestinibacter bartlettii TaxID=261299 RepID=UPI003992907D
MTKKYKVIGLREKQLQSQEVFINFTDTLNNENDRYIGRLRYEANEVIQMNEEAFGFESFPTIYDIEGVLHDVLKSHVEEMYIYASDNDFNGGVCIYDTETGDNPSNWKVIKDEKILDYLHYERKFNVYIGDLKEVYVE